MNDKKMYSVKWTQPYVASTGWRKRKVIDSFLNDLHNEQLKYIDLAVETSDLREANELIDYIKNKA